MKLIKKIKHFVGFDNPDLSLENKLFNAICLLLILSLVSGLVNNIILAFPLYLMLVETFVISICAFAFYQSRYVAYKEKYVGSVYYAGYSFIYPGLVF